MMEDLKEVEKDLENQIVEPEYVDMVKKNIQPVKDNYMTLSWVMYLLNQPARNNKKEQYKKRNKKLLESLDKGRSPDAVIEENKNCLKNIK